MLRQLYFFSSKVAYAFPVQLFIANIRKNIVLMFCWIILFTMVTGAFGKYLGVPYLFLDPEYMNQVGFTSFFFMGLVFAGFITAFHITCYIIDGHRFSFIGTLARPFTRFALNNSLIPFIFVAVYVGQVIAFQTDFQFSDPKKIAIDLAGFFCGLFVMTFLFSLYFRWTNKDIFKYVVCRIDEKIKENVKITRASAMKKLNIARKGQVRVDYYLDLNLKWKKVEDTSFYDKNTILQVFDQNHFNLVVIELLIFALIIVLGIFKDLPAFQLPAAASTVVFLTVFVMLSGAFSYWFGQWATTAALVIFFIFNHLTGQDFFTKKYEAFGLDYQAPPAAYTTENLRVLTDSTRIERDRVANLVMLENWRKKFKGTIKPKMIFLCVSGGGKRAALWTLTSLQTADSITSGRMMESAILITGASGGLIGASYFREMKLRERRGARIFPYHLSHRRRISTDNLNPLIFSLLANDLFVGFTKFDYNGNYYYRDRGYTFEEQLNNITDWLLDKPIGDYREPELNAEIPMIIFTPTVINDGRKLYIASRPVSFMNSDMNVNQDYALPKVSGVDFHALFGAQDASNLRFLSALRMSATFPYITPNTTLPTDPPIQIMDAGISDNFGLSDATRFCYAYRDWIAENTSGVIFLSVRDSPKLAPISPRVKQTFVDAITQPISSVYNNFENFQDINSDLLINHAHSWCKVPIDRIDLQYQQESYVTILQKMDSIRQNNPRASLSWRLTAREKENIEHAILSPANQRAIAKLKELLTQGTIEVRPALFR